MHNRAAPRFTRICVAQEREGIEDGSAYKFTLDDFDEPQGDTDAASRSAMYVIGEGERGSRVLEAYDAAVTDEFEVAPIVSIAEFAQ